jgi:predicted esterase
MNTLPSGGADRQFQLVLPADYDPAQSYPVFFLWHWLGGDADAFYQQAEVQLAADTQHFIAVIPEKKGDVLFTWPVDTLQSQARVDEEMVFFDDMLACVAEQYTVDTSCVASVGVSAGALWTDQLASARSTRLASFASLSGGTGGVIRPWVTAEHRLPGLVLWGGMGDTCQGLLSFETLSNDLETHLTTDGHFFLECIHNCGHSAPPFEGPMGFSRFKGMWDFLLDHPYWVSPGTSIYDTEGLSPDLPEWCAIGQGNAEERTGECVDPSQC